MSDEVVEFGWDRYGKTYTPSPEEIAAGCERIQASWSRSEERTRRQWSVDREELKFTEAADPR